MTDKKYAVVMKKKKTNGEFYILVPEKLVEGTLDTANGYYFNTTNQQTFLDISEPSSINNPQIEELVAYTISEKYLLQKYPNADIEEAKADYFKRVNSAINIAFYLQNMNITGIIPLCLQTTVDKLNNIQLEKGQSMEMDLFSTSSILPVDCYGYPLSPYELEQVKNEDTEYEEDYFSILLEELLKTDNVDIIHQVLKRIYDEDEDLQEIISSLSFMNMIQEAMDTSFEGISISDIFSSSCSQILSTSDMKKMKEIINLTSDFFTMIYCQIQENALIKNQPEVEASCDYLDRLTEQYQKLTEKSKDADTIHKKIRELKNLELDNMNTIQKNYKLVVKNTQQKEKAKKTTSEESSIINVAEAKKYLDERIIGQENAKQRIISAVWNKQIANQIQIDLPSYCLLVGPTGSGKTLLTKTIAKYLEIPSIIFDTTQLTATGYVGDSITDSLTRLLSEANNDVKKAEQGIIIFDEIDKKGSDSNKDIAGKGALNALLPYLDGRTYYLEVNKRKIPFKTDKLMIMATGSFAEAIQMKQHKNYSNSCLGFTKETITNTPSVELTSEDLIEYGGIPKELVARIPVIVMLEAHTKDSLKEILYRKNISPLYKNKEALHYANVFFNWTDDYVEKVALQSLELGYGARSLNNIVENTMMKAKWEVLSNMQTYSGFKVTGDTVDDSENAILYGYDGEEYQLKTILEEKKEKTKQYKITNKKCY